MPFVRIDLFEGRTLEQKKALAKEVTEAVVRNTGAPQSAVHVIINDMPDHNSSAKVNAEFNAIDIHRI